MRRFCPTTLWRLVRVRTCNLDTLADRCEEKSQQTGELVEPPGGVRQVKLTKDPSIPIALAEREQEKTQETQKRIKFKIIIDSFVNREEMSFSAEKQGRNGVSNWLAFVLCQWYSDYWADETPLRHTEPQTAAVTRPMAASLLCNPSV